MKSILTLLTVLFAFSGLFAQTDCTVKIVHTINRTDPPSYTFKTDPRAEGAKYYWYFGNEGTSDSPAPTYTFKASGEYNIKVKVVSGNNICYGELKNKFEGKTVVTVPVTISGKGKVKKTGTDGCGLLIYLENGTYLVPKEMGVPFNFADGQYVELAADLYKEKPSGCNDGIYAKINKITLINTTIPTDCNVKISFAKSTNEPGVYTFSTNSQPTGMYYYWTFGDNNSTSSEPSPKHTFSQKGSYSIFVKVKGNDGKYCTAEIKADFEGKTVVTVPVTISGKGKVKKTGTDGCGLLIAMDNGLYLVPKEMPTPFEFKDGQYVELAADLYKEKQSGCNDGIYAKITRIVLVNTTVPTECNVKISFAKSTNEPGVYTFSTNSQPTGMYYYWTFGDNTGTINELSPKHTFSQKGTYSIFVKVKAPDGKYCTAEIKADFEGKTVVTVPVTISGKGKVKKTGTDGCGLLIAMDNGLYLVPKEMPTPFEFKDGQYVELAADLYKEKQSGCNDGIYAKINKITLINTTVPTDCNVKISFAKSNVEPGTYTFSTNSQPAGMYYYWSFGDNTSTSSEPMPKHTFSQKGSYSIFVKVKGNDGKYCTAELKAEFEGKSGISLPICKGSIKVTLLDPTNNLCNGSATVKLLDEAGRDNPNVKYLWPDGRTGSSVKELCPGKLYTVKATLEGVCQQVTSFTLLAKPAWQTSSVNGQNIFTVIAPIQGVLYEWDFGNGITKTGTSVSYTFQQDGVYVVKLKAFSATGSSETIKQIVVANNKINAAVTGKIEVGIYPNPAKEILRVDLKSPEKGDITIEIKDISGQTVYFEKLYNDGSSHTDINIQSLKAGIYMLRIYGSQGIVREKKFIKN